MSEEVISKDDLGDRMKAYEFVTEQCQYAPNDKNIVLRLDGRGFSRYTKKYAKPFDIRVSMAMRDAAIAVYDEFNASVVYTQSDEISLIIPAKYSEKTNGYVDHVFGGRLQKIMTLASSVVSVVFDRSLQDNNIPMFDCRAMILNNHEATNAIFWRMLDCRRNAVSSLYRYSFGHAKMQNKSCNQMIEELGEKWINLDPIYQGGYYYSDTIAGGIGIGSSLWFDHNERVRHFIDQDEIQYV